MVKRTSALEINYKETSFRVDDKITLTFQEVKDLDIMQIAAWPSTIESIDLKLANIIKQFKV